MPPSTVIVPVIANKFWLQIDKYGQATLEEVSGLDDETDVSEMQQVLDKGKLLVQKIQGANRLKPGKITIKYIYQAEDPIRKWRNVVIKGTENPKVNVTLKCYDISGSKLLMTFSFTDCWVSKYSLSALSVKGNDPMKVTATIEHTGMQIEGYSA